MIVVDGPDRDPPTKRDQTYILDRPTSIASRTLHAMKWIQENNIPIDYFVHLDDDSFLSIPRLASLIKLHDSPLLLLGFILSTPIDVNASEIEICDICRPCNWCDDYKDPNGFCASLGLSAVTCVHLLQTCKLFFKGSSIEECLSENAMTMRRQLHYFGNSWAPSWPLGMGFVIGRKIVEFLFTNFQDFKIRASADIQFGFWIAPLEGVKYVHAGELGSNYFHDYPRLGSTFARPCSTNSTLVHRMRLENWLNDFDRETCTLTCLDKEPTEWE